jgi:hypothetical protein
LLKLQHRGLHSMGWCTVLQKCQLSVRKSSPLR